MGLDAFLYADLPSLPETLLPMLPSGELLNLFHHYVALYNITSDEVTHINAKLCSNRLTPMASSDPTLYPITWRQLVWLKSRVENRGLLNTLAEWLHPESLGCCPIGCQICFKPVTKQWCNLLQSQNMKIWKPSGRVEMTPLTRIPNKTFQNVFLMCTHRAMFL